MLDLELRIEKLFRQHNKDSYGNWTALSREMRSGRFHHVALQDAAEDQYPMSGNETITHLPGMMKRFVV